MLAICSAFCSYTEASYIWIQNTRALAHSYARTPYARTHCVSLAISCVALFESFFGWWTLHSQIKKTPEAFSRHQLEFKVTAFREGEAIDSVYQCKSRLIKIIRQRLGKCSLKSIVTSCRCSKAGQTLPSLQIWKYFSFLWGARQSWPHVTVPPVGSSKMTSLNHAGM